MYRYSQIYQPAPESCFRLTHPNPAKNIGIITLGAIDDIVDVIFKSLTAVEIRATIFGTFLLIKLIDKALREPDGR